ncbi:MAG: glycosyltransferase family 4 protein, partial [Gemmatimonadetes bacterium]|nr:glycosyltransferase family 4 protein [Gemmatimonadota bacterium]
PDPTGQTPGAGNAGAGRRSGKRVQRRLLRGWVKGSIAPSFFIRDRLLERFPDARAVAVVHNGVDLGRFRRQPDAGAAWRSAHCVARGEYLVGCVGQLQRRRKAQHVLIAAAAASRSRPTLAFVGEGEDESPLRDLAAAAGVRAVFAGFESDTVAAYNAFDVVALPSRVESFGLAVAEAMACARPVVAAHAGSVPELLAAPSEGRLFTPDDAGTLAEELDHLAEDPGLRESLGAAARARVERDFSLERMVQGYEEGFAAAVDGRFGEFALACSERAAGVSQAPSAGGAPRRVPA